MTARESFTCPTCGKTTFPTFVLSNAGKLVAQCANDECLFTDQSLGPADFSKGIASFRDEAVAGGEGWSGKKAVVVDLQAPSAAPRPIPVMGARPQPTASAADPPAMPMPSAPTNVIGMIEERAAWLAAEEARLAGVIARSQAELAGVRAESKGLTRMLRAAQRASAPQAIMAQQVVLRAVDAAS